MRALAFVLLGLLFTTTPVHPQAACDQMATAAAGFTTKVEVIPLAAASRIFICGYTVSAVAASVVTFQYGTGTACATGSTAIGPTIQLGATSTFGETADVFRGFQLPTAQALCATATAAANLTVYYTRR